MTTHYDTLQVKDNASQEVIKGAYRYLSQKWHPDKNPDNREDSERVLKSINQAYSVLSNPDKRRAHDEWINKQKSEADFKSRGPKGRSHSRAPPPAPRSPGPPPIPPRTQYSSVRQSRSDSIFENVKKVAKTVGFFVGLVIVGIAAKVAGGASSSSIAVENASRNLSQQTLEFLAEMEVFKVDAGRRADAIRNDYRGSLEASGWSSLFDADRVARDKGLVESKEIISLAKASLESYRESTSAYREVSTAKIRSMRISEEEKKKMLSGFETGSLFDDRLIVLEGSIFAEAEKVFGLLASSKDWDVENSRIVFFKEDELRLADSYFKKMGEINIQQQAIQVELAKRVGH